MNPQQTATSFNVTCETHDEAVLHCLNALAYFSERVGEPNATRQSVSLADLPAPDGWNRAEGRVTFHFSDQRRRGVFLGEATRLLSGKWLRLDGTRG